MNPIRKLPLASLILVLMAAAIAGCNIFGFTSDSEKSDIEKAEDAIRDGNYAKAKKELADAVKDSTDSMALYLNAKATILESGVDLATLASFIESSEDIASGDKLKILTEIDEMSDTEKTNWYRANMDIRANLSKIWYGQTAGVMKKKDIALGYTVSNMMSGVLGLRDTNRDGVIDANDFQLDLSFVNNIGTSGTDGFNLSGAKIKDDQGQVIDTTTFDGLTVFLGDWSGKAAGTTERYRYKPDDINPLIAYVLSVLSEGVDSVMMLLENQGETAFEAADIEENLDNIATIINYYWYDDGIDNDGDGVVDEEQIDGIDNDGDGLTDEDTDRHPSDTTNQQNTEYRHIWEKWTQ